jgi:predicted Rossmann-fold nucleotide-binding protein
MEAANIGVQQAKHPGTLSYGLTIDLPAVREAANRHLDIKSEHYRFSSRLDEFMRLSHAVIVAPGGIGTLLELAYVWQLIQVRLIERRTIVLLQRTFWEGLLAWMRQEMLGRCLVSSSDFDGVHAVDAPEEAVDLIRVELERFTAQQHPSPAEPALPSTLRAWRSAYTSRHCS